MTIDADLKALATARNFAALATLSADGQPRNHLMWIDADDEHLLINTEVHRQRYKNLQRDPRVTVAIIEAGNWYSWVEVRGKLVGEVRGEVARAHIDQLSHKYNGTDYGNPIQSERVILKIAPEKQIGW